MKTERPGGCLAQHAQRFAEDYEVFFAAHRWDRDRCLKLAEQLATKGDVEKAKRVLDAQGALIREQADR